MKTLISIKTDKDIKEKAQKLAEDLGLSLSAVVNVTLRQFVRSRELRVSTIPCMSKDFEDELVNIERDIEKDVNISPKFYSAKDAIKYLKSLD